MPTSSSQEKEYTVILRGPSTAIFRKDKSLTLTEYPIFNKKRADIIFKTRWITTPDGVEIPGHLLVVLKCNSDDNLKTSIGRFSSIARIIVHSLSFCSNAAIGEIEFEVGYESTSGVESRDFFQSYLPSENYDIHNYRIVDAEPTAHFMLEKYLHKDKERLDRAVYQYYVALKHWKKNHVVNCIAHLWMAMEALTKVKIRQEIELRGLENEQDLADDIGVEKKKLDSCIRKSILFKGDLDCYKKCKKASDGFEHGFLNLGKVQNIAIGTREKVAGYVREAIIDLVGLKEEYKSRLTNDVLSKPIGYYPYANYIKGKLTNSKDKIVKEGNEYPFVDWECRVKYLNIQKQGDHVEYELNNKFSPQIAKETELNLKLEIHKQT